jgi:DNA-binding transcriptional regulator YhcF (GntR family)
MSLLDDGGPIFAQIAAELANQIADGTVGEGERVASSNELAAFYRVNPATAARSLTVLSDEGLVEKRRGVGMFVAAGARDRRPAGSARDHSSIAEDGLIYRRAGLPGTSIFGATQLGALAIAAIITTWAHGWGNIGRFLTAITATGVTGALAVAVAVMLAGGFATIRRLTV